MFPRLSQCIAIATCLFTIANARAHHSYSEYDDKQIVEIEGTVVKVALQNPHVHFFVQGTDENGQTVTWDLESTTLNWLKRIKMPLELVEVGSRVRFAGWPSRRSGDRMYALNMLAADGREVLLFRTADLRWKTTALGFGTEESQSFYQAGVTSGSDTIFRVWASDLGNPGPRFAPIAPLALTEAAKQIVADFDPVTESTENGCNPKGMPRLMGQPPPMEVVDNGDTILIRTEEYESVRTIHMKPSSSPEAQPKSLLGYSVGNWEGKTLVVETSRLDSPYLSSSGEPLSIDAHMVERFTVAADGSRLDYSVIVTDPVHLLEPAELRRYWVSRPGEEVLPFNCKEL